jgi:hypothetical protein
MHTVDNPPRAPVSFLGRPAAHHDPSALTSARVA